MNARKRKIAKSCLFVAAMAASGFSQAADSDTSLRADVEQLKQQVKEASEWKHADSRVHLAGYGFVNYTDRKNSENGTFALGSFSPIFHYQYKDLLMMEAEVEMTYNADGETETTLEYAALDLFLNDYAVLVAGQFLSPIGQFRQNMHPAWINKMPTMPLGFHEGGAAPLSELGVELRGGFPIGMRRGNYAFFVSNGPRLIDNAGELEVETEGNNQDQNQNKTIGGRIGFLPMTNFEIGLSAETGQVNIPGEDNRDYNVADVDFALQPSSLVELRGEYLKTTVGELASSAIPEEHIWKASYIQASHKFAPTSWEAVVRYGKLDTPESTVTEKQTAIGINYLFAPNVIAKLAYQFNKGEPGTSADEDQALAQLAYGF
jgi:opacity protein-like surface antigen